MSRIWAAVVIAVAILGLCFLEAYQLNSAFNKAEKMVIKMQQEYNNEDNKSIKNDAKKLKKYWQSKEKALSFFLADSELDGVSLEISSLPVINDEDFLYYCNSILFKVRHLKEHISRSIF